MIECIINGSKTFPSLSAGLKIVVENPAMRNKSSYTYDIIFPLNIVANVKFFSMLGSMAVSVKHREYESCSLVVDNRVIFSGKGIVTGVSNTEVKMQIIQELESSMPSALSEVFIDKIPYMAVNSRYFQAVFDYGGDTFDGDEHGLIRWTDVKEELQSRGFIGEQGYYTFVQTLKGDSVGDNPEQFMNLVCHILDDGEVQSWPLYNLAVQPNFLYVLKRVLEYAGYSYDLSAIDQEPWTHLYVASTNRSLDIRDALPHWTIEKLLQETEKLFNISFEWNGNTVKAVKLWENEASKTYVIENEEEFERTYDEEGTEYEDSSNLTYQLSDTHDTLDTVSREAVEKFGIKEYPSLSSLESAISTMTDKEKTTSFFSVPQDPSLYYYHLSEEDGETSELRKIGLFRPIFRDLTSDSEKELNITPVAIERDNVAFFPTLVRIGEDSQGNDRYYLVETLWKEMSFPVANVKEYYEDWIRVQDVIEEGSSIEDEEDTTPLELMFVGPLFTESYTQDLWRKNGILTQYYHFTFITNLAANTDYLYRVGLNLASMSLNTGTNLKCLGEFHITQAQIDDSTGFNKHEETIFKFVSKDIPSIGNIFLIRNKRYVAKQLEVQLKESGYAKEITGHFYALDS
ncbi:MAG: hypothetical protein IJG07_05685 [Prevotella sp.]|nr:hypothetical protein [Prevotella sp.]